MYTHLLTGQYKVDITEYNLENGLHVILHTDTANPIVSVNIWYHVGSKDEDSNMTGFAHLFEHMMFQGSENVGKTEHFTYIQKAGGTLNGTTSVDRTNYFETVPSNQLELVLWLEADRMGYLNVTSENFDNQREVVKEEKRQNYDNQPYGNRFIDLMKRLYPEHPYRWLPIGSMEHLNNSKLDDAVKFYENFYAPDNAVLVVSGDFNTEEAKTLIQKYFGELKPSKKLNRNYPEITFNQGERIDTVYDHVHMPMIIIGYKTPGITSKETHALHLLSEIFGSGRSSRIYKNIVYESKLAKNASAFLWDNELAGTFVIMATAFPNTDIHFLTDRITVLVDNINTEGISEKELEKAKNAVETDFIERISTTRGTANLLAMYYTFYRNAGMINEDLKNYLDISAKDIISSVKKYLVKENRVVLYILPLKNN
jgi:predicted Zn-dependent peptidase